MNVNTLAADRKVYTLSVAEERRVDDAGFNHFTNDANTCTCVEWTSTWEHAFRRGSVDS